MRLTCEQAALVEGNLGLVGFVLRRHGHRGLEFEDAWQAGVVGLCHAARRFDPGLGRFSTFAVQEIRNGVRALGGLSLEQRRAVRAGRLLPERPLELSEPLLPPSWDPDVADVLDRGRLGAEAWGVLLDLVREGDGLTGAVAARLVLDPVDRPLMRDLAAEFGVTVSAVYARERRLLARLRERLGVEVAA